MTTHKPPLFQIRDIIEGDGSPYFLIYVRRPIVRWLDVLFPPKMDRGYGEWKPYYVTTYYGDTWHAGNPNRQWVVDWVNKIQAEEARATIPSRVVCVEDMPVKQ